MLGSFLFLIIIDNISHFSYLLYEEWNDLKTVRVVRGSSVVKNIWHIKPKIPGFNSWSRNFTNGFWKQLKRSGPRFTFEDNFNKD